MFRPLILCSAIAMAGTALLPAQQTINNASLEGQVTDQSGAVIPHASVNVVSQTTGATYKTETNREGRYRFAFLPPGHYSVRGNSTGFEPFERPVDLSAGTTLDIPMSLCVGMVESVRADASAEPALATTATQVASTVTTQEIGTLPLPSRNFLDLALLTPGVSTTNTAANQLFAETSAVPGQGLSINSQRNFSNAFLVDGLSANDDAAGLVQTAFPLDAIAELQVVTSSGQAEFGRALGGFLSFVTRSGTNAFHGTAYGFLRNKRLNAANPLTQSVTPMTQGQFGASLSGPLLRDRAWFFVNAEQRNLNSNGVLTISPANATQINAHLQALGYPGPLLNLGSSPTTLYSSPVHATNLFGRFDARLGERDTFNARYSLYHVGALNSRGAGGLTYTSAAAALEDMDHTVAMSNLYAISANTENETRAQWTRSHLDASPNDAVGPAVSISGVATFGTLSSSPTARYDTLFEIVDNLAHIAGSHSIRVGADFVDNDLTIRFPQSIRGNYAFASLANFLSGRYATFTQSFGNTVVPQSNPNLGVFAQDEWRATRSLTLNAGLRYDLQWLQSIATDTNNVAPRLGLAWVPFANRRTVLRASYGLFYDRVPLRALSNALESNSNSSIVGPNTFVTLAFSYGQAGAPTFPAIASGYTAANLPANVRLGIATMDPHLQNGYAQQASAEVEQELTPDLSFKLNFQHVRGEHLLLSLNRNTPSCTSAVDPVNLCRPVAGYANNKQYAGAGDSMYDGLSASLVKRPARWGNLRLSYTWSHALDDLGEFFFSSPINNFDVSEDWARSDDDQRHRVAFDAVLRSPQAAAKNWSGKLAYGWQLSGTLQYTSALPFNVVTGTQTVQQTTQRPCAPGLPLSSNGGVNPCTLALPGAVIARNTGTSFDSLTLNARLSRTFRLGDALRLEALAEAFNAPNHRNNLIPNATFGTGNTPNATFGTPTAVGDPRSVELALRLSF